MRGDIQSIAIGEHSNIQDGSILHVTHDSRFNPGGHGLVIGGQVTVGHQVVLHGCHVGGHCLVGMGSVMGRILAQFALGASVNEMPFPVTTPKTFPLHRFHPAGVSIGIKWHGMLDLLETIRPAR